ncbi:MAG: hypothetical protein ABII90_04325 [Bacteroidota bacterium]
MKKKNLIKVLIISLIINFLSNSLFAQQNVGFGTNTPDPSAILDLVASDKGLLIPRVILNDANTAAPVTSPATGVLIYNNGGTEPDGFWYWDGSQWVQVGAGGSSCVTLDEAYDCGGNGAGRTITADNGAVKIQKTTDYTDNHALHATVTSGIVANPSSGIYVEHSGQQGVAVYGEITNTSNLYSAVQGISSSNQDESSGLSGWFTGNAAGYGVYGNNQSNTAGSQAILGLNERVAGGWGVEGAGYNGVYGWTNENVGFGIVGYNYAGIGGIDNSIAVYGQGGTGVQGETILGTGFGVFGKNVSTSMADNDIAVCGMSNYGAGVWGEGANYFGVVSIGDAYVQGNLTVTGNLTKGGGAFKIDHPQDPENKYLIHSFVESPDMMNIYNGNVILDNNGETTVELPDYNEVLNIDFKYQLTPVGSSMPNLYIAEEVQNNSFKIAGGVPNKKVSWQITGIRNDKWAQKYRIIPELEKENKYKGKYLHPELYGKSIEDAMIKPLFTGPAKTNTLVK